MAGTSNYLTLFQYEAPDAQWDIKVGMIERLSSEGVILCGEVCDWYDYSVPGNIQFGYVAELMGIPSTFGDLAGGLAENFDLLRHGNWGEIPGLPCSVVCDNAQDQAAVDFGRHLAQSFPSGVTPAQFASELTVDWTSQFQRPPSSRFSAPYSAAPGTYVYPANYFDRK